MNKIMKKDKIEAHLNKPAADKTIKEGEIIFQEESGGHEAEREADFERCIRISLEKLAGYSDSQLLAVYSEHNRPDEIDSRNALIVKNVAELRENIIKMRDVEKAVIQADKMFGRFDPEIIMIAYDDLPPGNTTETAKKRWVDFYDNVGRRQNSPEYYSAKDSLSKLRESLSMIGTPGYREAEMDKAIFEGLNKLRGLRGDRIIAIRDLLNESLYIYSVAELRQLIEDMRNRNNILTHGNSFEFAIEEYDKAEKYLEREQMEDSLRDMGSKRHLLKKIAQYSDDTLLVWVHPNEMVNLSSGDFMCMQDSAADLRRRIQNADHQELDWFNHAGGINVIVSAKPEPGDDIETIIQKNLISAKEILGKTPRQISVTFDVPGHQIEKLDKKATIEGSKEKKGLPEQKK